MPSKLKFLKSRRLLTKVPPQPGVYFFWENAKIIYVGKAVNLKNRISSYLSKGLGAKTQAMINEATELSFLRATSELDALLLEASLIKTFQPKYNFAAKDDKHPLYIRITKEEFPRVITARKIDETERNIAFFGPFPSSSAVRGVLKMIRRIIPFSDHKLTKKPCLYSHLGLCDPCPSIINRQIDSKLKEEQKKKYLQNIHLVVMVLARKTLRVERLLLGQMKKLAKTEHFEEASQLRDKLIALEYVTQKPIAPIEFLRNPNLVSDLRAEEQLALRKMISQFLPIEKLTRIECYDVAHLAGTNPTASLVCFIDAEAEKNYYRRFKIYQKVPQSDVHSLAEVAQRRIKHLSDWGIPDLIIVDGGKAQVAIFRKWFEPKGIPVVGIAKRFESLVIPTKKYGSNTFTEIKIPQGPALNLVVRIRDEAHRFARRYHHLLVSKAISENFP